MTSEAVSKFVESPTVQGLKTLKKNELLGWAQHLDLENVKASLRKSKIARKLAEYYIHEEVCNKDDIDHLSDPAAKNPCQKLKLRHSQLS